MYLYTHNYYVHSKYHVVGRIFIRPARSCVAAYTANHQQKVNSSQKTVI